MDGVAGVDSVAIETKEKKLTDPVELVSKLKKRDSLCWTSRRRKRKQQQRHIQSQLTITINIRPLLLLFISTITVWKRILLTLTLSANFTLHITFTGVISGNFIIQLVCVQLSYYVNQVVKICLHFMYNYLFEHWKFRGEVWNTNCCLCIQFHNYVQHNA